MFKLSLIFVTAVLGTSVLAQMGHPDPKNAKHVITCPVSGEKVDMVKATKARLFADYKGNRYFFCCKDCPPTFAKNPAKYASKPHVKTPVMPPMGVQKSTITVNNGFSPKTITVRAGQPVQLTFDTKHRGCATTVNFSSLGISKALKDGSKTIVTFTPKKPGTIVYACPMNMYKGTIIVK
jgi:YHS domain-containing protein